jgi:hypothetical protein
MGERVGIFVSRSGHADAGPEEEGQKHEGAMLDAGIVFPDMADIPTPGPKLDVANCAFEQGRLAVG